MPKGHIVFDSMLESWGYRDPTDHGCWVAAAENICRKVWFEGSSKYLGLVSCVIPAGDERWLLSLCKMSHQTVIEI
jgi:hypothetical protein